MMKLFLACFLFCVCIDTADAGILNAFYTEPVVQMQANQNRHDRRVLHKSQKHDRWLIKHHIVPAPTAFSGYSGAHYYGSHYHQQTYSVAPVVRSYTTVRTSTAGVCPCGCNTPGCTCGQQSQGLYKHEQTSTTTLTP